MMMYHVVVIGGGPCGATAAHDPATAGRTVAMLDRAGRIKPCGGAIPPRLISDFNIPASQIVARILTARMISPTQRAVDIPIENGFVGMVDRENFDEFLRLRASAGLAGCETIRREGVPIPLRPMDRWDNGRDVVLAGDAAGVVAPSSGEGIYYGRVGGRVAATVAQALLASGKARDLKLARKRFMKEHGMVFRVLRSMQDACYKSDERRERFVSLCHDVDVQRLTFDAYMNKRLVRAHPMAHIRIGLKNLAHLLRLVPTGHT